MTKNDKERQRKTDDHGLRTEGDQVLIIYRARANHSPSDVYLELLHTRMRDTLRVCFMPCYEGGNHVNDQVNDDV